MSPQTTVFLLAGNRLLREALSRILKTKSDISVAGTAPYSPQAIQQIAESNCQILLLDSVTSAASDFQFVRRVIEVVPGLKVIMIGMDENEEAFLSAVRGGRPPGSGGDGSRAGRLRLACLFVCSENLVLFGY